MQKKQIAVIDIGSSKINVLVGERGVNNTFVIKYSANYEYDGFAQSEFLDIDNFCDKLNVAGRELKSFFKGNVNSVYIGVPGAFTELLVKDCQISFPKKKKITEKDINDLYDSAYTGNTANFTLINRSAVLYELDDFRRIANPLGFYSEILKSKLSFILCKNYFIEIVEPILKSAGIKKIEFVSSVLSEALYLIEPDNRDRVAVLLDVGYISSTLSIIQGDGILFMKSFDFGGGYITADLVDSFSLSFEEAEKLKRRINLTSLSKNGSELDVIEDENHIFYKLADLKNSILSSLDNFCEMITIAFDEFKRTLPEYVSLMITGGGITYLRGAKEHIAGRLNMSVQVVEPNVPMLKKTTMSSVLSLLDLALGQN